jgi:rhodanese-related sulfurtransferase
VRTEEEFIEQRIPGAKLIPDTEVTSRAASELSDKNALVLVYCRSGRRSADAAKELVAMGYSRVYDFGGIIDWPYETESGEQGQLGTASDPLANPVQGKVIIRFDYEKQQGYASNQFAVWIADIDGNLVKTLCATRYTAQGGYKARPESIPSWVQASGLSSLYKDQVDAVSEATPKSGRLAYSWDLTLDDGRAVSEAEGFKYFVEGSLRWKNRALYSAEIDLSDGAAFFPAVQEYHFEESDDQQALTEDSPESGMILNVEAEFIPAKTK